MKIKTLKYINQSTDDLTYLFAIKPINIKNNFKIIRRKKYVSALGKLELLIIGESHAVSFKSKNINLTEILACVKNKYLYQISQKNISIKNLRKKITYKYKNIFFDYSFFAEKTKISSSSAIKILANFKTDMNDNKLFFEWQDKKFPSFTFMEYKIYKDNLFRINTSHFYKNDSMIISTVSTFRITDRLSPGFSPWAGQGCALDTLTRTKNRRKRLFWEIRGRKK
jgi:hypothetical protein